MRTTPYSRGWDAFYDGVQFGLIPPHYKRAARVRWCMGWKDARAEAKAPMKIGGFEPVNLTP